MADFVFNLAKGKIAELAERVNVENPANSVFVLVAISTTEEDAILRDLDSLEDVLTNPNTDEATNGGYARLDVEALTVTVDDVENKVAVSMRDQSWSDILAGLAWTDVLICYEPEAGAGDDSQIVPLVCLDFAVVPNGMDITVLFDADGFFESASIIEDQAVVTALATETSSALAASVGGVAADLISSSADGFHVAWNATGEVLSIKDDATAMPLKSGQLGGFYLRDATTFGTPTDGISNGDFATGTTVGWTESLGGDATVLDDSGTKYVQLSNGPIMMWQNWTVQSGKTYIIRGYHRYTAGTASYWWTNFVPIGSTAAGDPFTWWKWEYSDPRSSVGQWTINGNATNTSWEAWSHTVWVPDGCSTMRIELRRFAGTGTSEFKEITVEDLDAAGTRMTHTVTAGTGGDVDFACTGESCTLAATITEETDHLMVTGTIVGDSASEKALFLDFCLPLDQTSMKWAQNYDTEIDHDANAINVYYESHHPTIRSEWQLVTFPVAAVTDATRGVCVANSIEIPRHHKPFRDDNGVFLRHHVGLHANRNTFSFKFAVYKFDEPEWHMRSAMAKYRAIFADQFVEYLTSPNHRHGTQIYTLNGVVADTYDFGIAYNFRGAVDPGFVSNHNDGVAHCPHGMGTELSVSTISDPELSDATQAKDLMDGFETGMDLGINFTWPTTGGTYALDRHDPPGPFSVERTRFDNSKIQTLTGALILFDFTYPLQVLGTNASPQCTSPNAHDLEFDYLTVPQVALHTDESLDFRGHSHDNCAIGAGRTEENYNSGDFAAMTTEL